MSVPASAGWGRRDWPLISVFGMRRSGNHAVIDWLRRNLPKPGVFLNDCDPGDPYASFEMMETGEGVRHGAQFRDTDWFGQFPARRGIWPTLVSYEDRDPAATPPPAGWSGRRWRRVVLRRSFLNWLASYYRLVAERQAGTRWGVSRPEEIAAAFPRYAAHLTPGPGPGGDRPPVVVCFDGWAADRTYRRDLLRRCGLPLRDEGVGAQADYGGGSSFQPGTGAPCFAELSQRWRSMEDNPAFLDLCRTALESGELIAGLEVAYPGHAERIAALCQARPAWA